MAVRSGPRSEGWLRKLLKRQCRAPRVMVTEKLPSYGAAKREVMAGVEHRQHKGLNNRAEKSHQPTRRRERQMEGFKSARQAQRFLSAHDQIANLFHLRRDHVSTSEFRAARARAFEVWAGSAGSPLRSELCCTSPSACQRSGKGRQVECESVGVVRRV